MEFLRIGPQDKFCAKLKLKNLQLLNYYGKVVMILGYSLEINSVRYGWGWMMKFVFLWLVCQIEVEQTRCFWARAAKVISKEIVAQPNHYIVIVRRTQCTFTGFYRWLVYLPTSDVISFINYLLKVYCKGPKSQWICKSDKV